MVDITVTVHDADDATIEDIKSQFKDTNNALITVQKMWPVMNFGDMFRYDNVQYTFLKYMSREKVRVVSTKALLEDNTVQPVYFDCTRVTSNMQFFK